MVYYSLDSFWSPRATVPLGTALLEHFGHTLLAKQVLGGAFLLVAAIYLWKQSLGCKLGRRAKIQETTETHGPKGKSNIQESEIVQGSPGLASEINMAIKCHKQSLKCIN